MPLTEHAKNAMLDALARGVQPKAIDRISLHTAEPNAEGNKEVSGGEYARKAVEWNSAASGAIDDKTNGIAIKIPAKTTVKYVGYWSDAAGTPKFEGWDDIPEESFNEPGTYTVEDLDLTVS